MNTISLVITVSVLLILLIIVLYNNLISKKNEVDNAYASVDVQLKMRYDLIPNLVASVKKYAEHERTLLEEITALRTKVLSDTVSPDEKITLDNEISQGMKSILVAVENYPDLKASETFVSLQKSLNEVESQISASRRAYNAQVTLYNNSVQIFPSNIMALIIGFKRKPVFVIPEEQRQNVDVKELLNS